MYATVRNYSGSSDLVDALVDNRDAVIALLTGIDGFRAYHLVRKEDGDAVSVTVYDDQSGAEESNRQAAEWIQSNVPDLSVSAPEVLAGEVVIEA
jgi:heme-degrading monooxygenase HmoA